jgi:hypothetical protein
MKKLFAFLMLVITLCLLSSAVVHAEWVTCPECGTGGANYLETGTPTKEYSYYYHWWESHERYQCVKSNCGTTFWVSTMISSTYAQHSMHDTNEYLSAYHQGNQDVYTVKDTACYGCDYYTTSTARVPCNGGSTCCGLAPNSFEELLPY